MNKIYKLIWSQTANAFVAVSELATARGKSSSTTNNAASSADKKAGIFKPAKTALVLSMLFVLPHSVMAAENVDANNLTVAGTSTFTGAATFNGGITANSITVGGKAVATSDQITNLETKKADKTAVDALSNQKADKTAVDALDTKKADKTAVDALDTKKADKTAVDALSNQKADKTTVDALSNRVTANETQLASLGLTNEYTGIKYFRVKSTANDAQATGTDSVAIGPNTTAAGANATAVGQSAYAGNFGLAAGSNARAAGVASIALGQNALSTSESTVAIGKGAQAQPWRTISIGQDAGKNQTTDVIGDKNEHINIGVKAGENIDGQLNISIGQKAGSDTKGKGNIALGQNAGQHTGGTDSSVGNNIAIGTNANRFSSSTGVQEATAIGFGATASGTRSVALGKETKATALDSVAIGTSSQANGTSSVAIGLNANVTGADNVALGAKSVADTKAGNGYLTGKPSSTVVSVGNDTLQRRIVNVADGADDQDAVTVAQLKKVSDEVYNKVNTQINGITAAAGGGINYDTLPRTTTENSITLNKDGKKTIIGSVAAGTKDDDAVNVAQLNQTVEENKTHYFSTKVNGATQGNYNNDGAQGDISLAVGMDVLSTGDRSVTVGNKSTAESKGGIAIGALYEGSAALDDKVPQNAVQTVAKSSNGQPFEYNMAIGAGASSEGNNSIAIGSLAKTSTKQQQNTSPDRAIAIGYFAAASEVKANAIGDRATSSAEKANAFGSQAFSSGVSSTAIGTVAQASGQNSIAMGTHQRVTGANSGSIGYAGAYTPTNVGRDPSGTHANNATLVSGTGTYSVGNTNSTVTSNESGIFGNDNFIQAVENVRVVGNKNTVSKNNPPPGITKTLKDVYITGYNNQVDVAATPMANSKNLFIMGAANKIGTKDALTITDSYVIGTNNTINTSNTASASDDPSNPGTKVGKGYFILGNNVTATKENSVYLGTDAAYRAKGATTDGDAAVTEPVTVGGTLTYGNFAGKTPVGVVTVGDVGKERRIQNVAAGLISATSTDAINGSQLYATNAKLGNVANTVVKNFGGNATLNPDGSITYTNIGNTGKDNIHDAIQAATTVVKPGTNVVVDEATNKTTGQKEYTVNAWDTTVSAAADSAVTVTPTIDDTKRTRAYEVTVNTDGNTIKVENGKLTANTAPLTTNTDGKVNTPAAPNALATAGDIANAINNSGWKLAADGTSGTELINPSDTVTFKTGSSNLTVKRDGANITYDLAKDININSVKFGNNGPTIKADASNNINIAKSDGSPTKITNVKAGEANTDAVNVSQLKAVEATANQGWNLTTNGKADSKSNVKPGDTVDFANTDGNVKIENTDNKVEFGLNSTLSVGKAGEPGKVGIKGADGKDAISLNGEDGTIGLKGADGKDGISLNGKDGTIGINGKDGANATLTVEKASPALDGKDGQNGEDGQTRIVYTKPNGSKEEVATMNDGLNFKADDGSIVAKKLNETLDITGGADKDGLTDKNIGVNNKDGKLVVQLAKDINLTDAGSVTIGDTKLNNNSLTVGGANKVTVDGETGIIKGLTNTTWDPNATYTGGQAATQEQLKSAGDQLTTKGLNFAGNQGAEIHKDLGQTLAVKGALANDAAASAKNLRVDSENGELIVKISENPVFTTVQAGKDGDRSVLSKDGLTITNEGKPTVSLTENGLDNGNNQIVNVASGLTKDGNKVELKDAEGSTLTNAVNVGDLKEAADNLVTTGFNIADGKGGNDNVKLGETVTFTDPAGNIITTVTDNKVEFGLNSTLSVGKAGEPGKVGIKGADGKDAISLNGEDGTIGLKGADGKDGISLNGKDGTIGINGKDGANATLTVEKASPALDGKDGQNGEDGQTRIVYTKPNGSKEEVATMNDGLNFKADDGSIVAKKLNETLDITGGADKDGLTDKNIGVNNKDGKLVVQLAKDINLTDAGSVTIGDTKLNNNSLTVGGANKVTVDGETGIIKGLTNTTWDPNATYTGGQAATQEQLKSAGDQLTTKGLNFNGNKGDNIHKNLGDTLLVKGSLDNKADASSKNLRVDSENGELIVKISENPVFTTVQAGKDGDRSVLSKDGLTITNVGKATVSLTENGLDNGNNQIVNVASGLTKDGNKVELKDAEGNTLTNAVNVGDLKEAANNLVTTGFNIADGKGGNDNVKLGETVTFTDPAGNIITTVTDNKVEFGLNSTLSVGKAGEPGKVGIKGADGKDAISLNGEDGTIGLKGADGKDGISLNGKDGTIGINGKDGTNATLTVEKASPALDGKDGQNGEDGQTRIVYTKPNGSKEEVATLNDGLNFGANAGTNHAAKLNSLVDIKGADANTDWSKFDQGANIMTNVTTDANGNGRITVGLAKDLKGIDSITVNNGPVINGNGIDMNGDKITNVKAGTEDNDAVNVSQLKAVEATANKGWNLTTNGKAESKSNVKPGDTVDFNNTDGNVKIKNTGNNVTVDLNKDIKLAKDGSVTIGDTKVNNDGLTIAGGPSVTKSGINAGDKKITNVAPGEISADSKDAINGSQLYNVQKAAVAAKTEVKAGDNVEVKKGSGDNGQDIYTVSAKDTSASVTAGSTAVAVTKGATTKVGTTDVTDYEVDLSQATKDNIQKGVDAKDIVDNKGLTFAGDNNSSTEVQKLGSTVNVNGDSNITTQASGNTVKVTLNPNVTVESLTATNSVNVGSGGAQVALTTNVGKDGVRELSVGSANAPTRITNVAPGVDATDAVNVSQLQGLAHHINNRIDDVSDEANAGVSSAMAMAALPQAYLPGKSMLTGGIASYNGEGAVAVGFSKLSDNGRWVLKVSGSADTQGNAGGAVGAGFHF